MTRTKERIGMKPELWIENNAVGKNVARDVRVYILLRDDEGNEADRVDISNIVRAADVRLHVGEVVTAKLEVFLTGAKSRADVEQILVREFKPRRIPWWRRAREITTFGRSGVQEYIRR